MSIQIKFARGCGEREPLIRPFTFKGGRLSALWQAVAGMESATGDRAVVVHTQSPLWSDATIFAERGEDGSNELMFSLTRFALARAEGQHFETPFELFDDLFESTLAYGRKQSDRADLRLTFVLNALVAVDAAVWGLYAKKLNTTDFMQVLPTAYHSALSARQERLSCIPLITYTLPEADIVACAKAGACLLKVKIGADPDGDGDREKMLEWDKARLACVHQAVQNIETPWTTDRRIHYYLDANGRYDRLDRLEQLLEHARKIGAFDRISLLEEPFPEESKIKVGGLGVRVAADESAHCVADVRERIDLGYGAIALKPIAKTLSMSLRIATVAEEAGIPVFCADLTAAPLSVEWNRVVAARLPALPEFKVGVMESNGEQNYQNWAQLQRRHPRCGASWTEMADGCFSLNADFYACSGGIFEHSPYADLVF